MKQLFSVLLGLLMVSCSSSDPGPKIYQFEGDINSNIIANKSEISLSTDHQRDGVQSLKWDYQNDGSLEFIGDVGFTPFVANTTSQNKDSFIMWVYNEKPQQDNLTIEFYKGNQKKTYFTFNLNFSGWRTMWVKYEQDMDGKPTKGIDRFVINAPKNSGTLYFDQIMPNVSVDPRHATRDGQVDFVNMRADTSVNRHWVARKLFYDLYEQNTNALDVTPQPQAINIVRDRMKGIFTRSPRDSKATQKDIASLQKYLSDEVTILGPYNRRILLKDELTEEEYNLANDFVLLRSIGTPMRNLASDYLYLSDGPLKKQIEDVYVQMLFHLYDQGWDTLSGQGTISHLGYQFRELGESILLMEDMLRSKNINQNASDMLSWFNGTGMVFEDFATVKGSNVDVLNTLLANMVTSALLHSDPAATTKILTQIKLYFDHGIINGPGLVGGFKDDGSGFHHMQHYPAYMVGAMVGFSPILYAFSDTPFAFSPEAHQKSKNYLLAQRRTASGTDVLLSISGRHPNNSFKIKPSPYYYYAMAGSPDKTESIDIEMARAFLKFDQTSDNAKKILTKGLRPEETPNGTWTMNMASLQLHRKNEWLVAARGYSRYLVGNETYAANNLYGRYMSYGQFQFMQNGAKQSGFVQEGWDWAHFPGTTAIAVPLEKVKSHISQVDVSAGVEEMLLSEETYAGGNSLNNTGMYAMKLKEHPKYNGSHKARKSYFFFDNKVVFLGTGITNNDSVSETHTTIFQNYIGDKTPVSVNSNQNHTIITDTIGNTYLIPAIYKTMYKAGLQNSFDQAKNTPTSNNFELAYINHATAPTNDSYEYSMLIQASLAEQEKFAQDQLYTVIQQDNNAHIVKDNQSQTMAYAFFEAQKLENDPYIQEIDVPSMVLLQNEGDSLELSFVNPDLSLYEGKDESQYDKKGNLIEVSIYSRDWRSNDSIPLQSTLVLKGKWNSSEEHENIDIQTSGETTTITFTTTYATPTSLSLQKI